MGWVSFFQLRCGGFQVPGSRHRRWPGSRKGFFAPVSDVPFPAVFLLFSGGCVKLSEKSVHKTAIRKWNGWLFFFCDRKNMMFLFTMEMLSAKKNVSNRFMIKLDPHTKIQGNSLVERIYHPKSLKHPTFFIAWDLRARGFWVPKNYLWKLRASSLPWSPTARCWVYAGVIIWGIFKQKNKQIALVRI